MAAHGYAAEFAELEAAWEADIVPLPPFAAGMCVVERRAPQHGSLRVTRCWQTHGYWRVECERPGCIDSGPPETYARVPRDGWREPPCPPNLGDPYSPRLPYPLASLAERVRWARAMAAWWSEVGALVDADLAEREAAGMRQMARMLIEEEGRDDP